MRQLSRGHMRKISLLRAESLFSTGESGGRCFLMILALTHTQLTICILFMDIECHQKMKRVLSLSYSDLPIIETEE